MSLKEESIPILTQERNMIFLREDVIEATRKSQICFDRAIMVRIAVPGDNKCDVEYKAKVYYQEENPHPMHGKVWKNEDVYRRFGKYLDEWEEKNGQISANGTPIESWPMVTKTQAHMMKYNGVHTVEMLSGLTDGQLPPLGQNARQLVQQAKDWIESKKNASHMAQIAAQKEELEARFAVIEARLAEKDEFLMAMDVVLNDEQRNAVKAEVVKRRGRPPKVQNAA